jgi:hypothetical protein
MLARITTGLIVSTAFAGSAYAQFVAKSLEGRWQIVRETSDGLNKAVMEIDREGQVRMQGCDATGPYSQCGLLRFNSDQVEIVFTSSRSAAGYTPDHFRCQTSSARGFFTCYNDKPSAEQGKVFPVIRHDPRSALALPPVDSDVCRSGPQS